MILAQDELELSRFLMLGAPAKACYAAGNLKYLTRQKASPHPGFGAIDPQSGARLVVAGSLHDDEIIPVLNALHDLGRGIRIIIAPRHTTGVELAVRHSRVLGRRVKRRSDPDGSEWEILVLDTMGELPHVYSMAACAIVGGGFGRHGGHNLFEPVIAGTPVVFGQHFNNFASEARILSETTPDAQLSSVKNLTGILLKIFSSEERRSSFHSLQKKAIPDEATTKKRYLELLGPRLAEMSR
jgi:3-deoxy-D-manno-octulosonic-acid transferase